MQQDLFSNTRAQGAPLADRMRPRTLDEFIGQAHIVGPGRLLRRAIELDRLQSSIFFGPPGCGKTTLANIIANVTGAAFEKLNAVTAGVKDVREIIAEAEKRLSLYGKSTYLLLDECHRWNKAQSDSILPALEQGTIRFIGSTTENPMISMTGAIVSRCRVFQFYPLNTNDIERAILQALRDAERGLGSYDVSMDDAAMEHLCRMANGDCRAALNALELAVLTTPAALAWFSRLIYGSMDPRIIARRLIAHASEDIGMANPQAMVQAVSAATALEHIGMPEARLPLAQAIVFLCECPKSNAIVVAVDRAMQDAATTIEEPVPIHLRDTSYAGAKVLGAGKGYKYPHDYPNHYVQQDYLPPSLKDKRYYLPSDQGSEKTIQENHRRRGQGIDES